MGVKRWLLAIIILFVVLGFILFFFMQSGPEKKIADSFIPKIENRYGVIVKYESISVSLTAVSLKNVELLSKKEHLPFAKIDRLGINVRVGPLLTGNLEITGIRIDGISFFAGKQSSGASLQSWKELKKNLSSPKGSTDKAKSTLPEIDIVSGDGFFNNGKLSGTVKGIKGRVTPGNKAVIRAENITFNPEKQIKINGGNLLIDYDFQLKHLAVEVDNPKFLIPSSKDVLLNSEKNIKSTLNELGFLSSKQSSADSEEADSINLDAVISLKNGEGKIRDENGNSIEFQEINSKIISNDKQLLSLRASGGVEGTDAPWLLQFNLPRDKDPELIVEIPDLPLKIAGPMLFNNQYIDFSTAGADAQVRFNYSKESEKLSAEGVMSISGITFLNNSISEIPLENIKGTFDFKASYLTKSKSITIERVNFSNGPARVTFRGDINLEPFNFDLRANVPPTSCRQIFTAIPEELRNDINNLALEGKISFDLHLGIDLLDPDKTVLEGNLDNRCKISNFGDVPHPDDFRHPFTYMGYSPDGKRIRLTTGAGTSSWTTLSSISPYLVAGVLTTEDGKFYRHNGLTLPEMRSAIVMNLKKGGMLHGASTITMQLAKNLFLSRDKTLKRKLEELFFTWYLESNFTKDELLELYFNVIEFGPSIYGIGPAAMHYFGREPFELNLAESIFLIKLLPNPIARYESYKKNIVTPQKMASIHRVMETMLARGKISKAEYRLGLDEEIKFYHEGDPLPEPRDVAELNQGGRDLSIPLNMYEDDPELDQSNYEEMENQKEDF
ncbi:MAG: transglycosylase domain-containing protein [Deltaproteobacteria bacterium]|nr:transglycosylase domain-containing protein [Deltaproteobacteria bacterium]